ncbi:MAG: PPOX class F420-dependent oxidoreductase [Candidatus Promineifilaceae bacterium]|nr:PPOX class F420-dependent oxidoreductase [Candidatus Promineifilaceae bacterium]
MSENVPESHEELLAGEIYAKLGTIMPDGRPQVHQVWCDYDGQYVRVNTLKGRQKDKNLRQRRYATLLLVAPDDPYYWMEIRGHVAERVEGGEADAHIDALAQKYLGQDVFPGREEGHVRVMYKIEPGRIVTGGSRE